MQRLKIFAAMVLISGFAVQAEAAPKYTPAKRWWTCEEWVAKCNPKGGHCNNPSARVFPSCSHHGNA